MTMPVATITPAKRFTVKAADGTVIGKAELRQVAVQSISPVSTSWVHEHLPFDPKRAGALVLSSRAGGPYCIDGGHRLALAREDGATHLNAFVIEGLSQNDEARLFTLYQRERRNLTSFDLFRADMVAGNPETIAMERTVRQAGFHIGKTFSSPNTITAIDSLRYVQRLGGSELLARVLRTVRSFWIGEEKALSGQVLKGLGLFLQSAGEQAAFDEGTLEKTLNALAPVKIVRLSLSVAHRRGAAPAATASNVAEVINDDYNKRVHDESKKLRLTIGNKRRNRPARSWAKS